MFRGYLTLAVIGIVFLLADLFERLVVSPLVRIRHRNPAAVLTAWMRGIAGLTLSVVRLLGGARIGDLPRIEPRGRTLLVMNHQSLLDIPIAARCLADDHMRFVTRIRYARGIPLVSHMVRLYDCPLVDPRNPSREQVEALAAESTRRDSPLLIFPEGTRTRDGRLLPFRRSGLRAILGASDWSVHLLVVDGFWRCGRLADFVRNVSAVRARVRTEGPFRAPRDETGREEFIDMLHSRISHVLMEMRDSPEVRGEVTSERAP